MRNLSPRDSCQLICEIACFIEDEELLLRKTYEKHSYFGFFANIQKLITAREQMRLENERLRAALKLGREYFTSLDTPSRFMTLSQCADLREKYIAEIERALKGESNV